MGYWILQRKNLTDSVYLIPFMVKVGVAGSFKWQGIVHFSKLTHWLLLLVNIPALALIAGASVFFARLALDLTSDGLASDLGYELFTIVMAAIMAWLTIKIVQSFVRLAVFITRGVTQ
jgi:hypothetical protein